MNIVIQLIVGLLTLGFLILIHELGHFIVAKLSKVKVNTFSIGFGPKILKWQWGETLYCLSAIPFGGYVAMAGERPEDATRSYSEGDFQTQPKRIRAAIAFAGPMVNILFAFALLFGIYTVGYPKVGTDLAIVGYIQGGSAAEEAGLLVGDTISKIENRPISHFSQLYEETSMALGRNLDLEVHRKSQILHLNLRPKELRAKGQDLGVGDAGISPAAILLAKETPQAGTPAGQAGVQQGDTLLEFNGKPILVYNGLIDLVQKSAGQTSTLLVGRTHGQQLLQIQPKAFSPKECGTAAPCYLMKLEIKYAEHFEREDLTTASIHAWNEGLNYAIMPFRFIDRMITGGIKVKAMSGPVGIVQTVGKTFDYGLTQFLMLLALISMNLGIMNLLPLAITDGGILFFLALEALRGKALSPEVQGRINQIAISLFVFLFLYVMIQDILRIPLFLD